MKKAISIFFAIIAWFAVVTQFYLMLENRTASITETIIRFFSFFTILTNSLAAVYFTYILLGSKNRLINKPGTLTAVTTYITIVGLVYQLVLRHLWKPQGLQMVVDELLHSVVPVFVIIFWYLYERKELVKYGQISQWMIFPLIYLVYILIRGKLSGFYPYPFMNVSVIGFSKVLVNSIVLLCLFVAFSAVFVWFGKVTQKNSERVEQ